MSLNSPTHEEVTLFADDFADLPIRVIAGDYSPAGEYHVVPALAESGRWRETVLHSSFRRASTGNWQVVRESDGGHALEQTAGVEKPIPMLAAGEPVWREVTVTVQVHPLTEKGWRAILFRYRHGRCWYGAVFADGKLQLLRRINDAETVLGEAACVLDPERYSEVRIVCRGSEMRVFVDGHEALRGEDGSPEAFLEGGIAFAAGYPTRFRDVRVTAPREAAAAVTETQRQQAASLAARRASAPRPRLWKKIATPRWGTDRNLRVGDLNGDGRPEIVLARRTFRLGGDNFASITSLAAYDLDGRQLWTIGEPDEGTIPTTCDLCFQVHDLDGDGRAEVMFCRDWELHVADGRTGAIRQSMPLPRPLQPDPARPYRILGDCLYFCDLTGSGRPDSILLKDRYKFAWAYDRDLRPLWSFAGTVGHFPFARDIDGDGRDEIAIGYHLLDHDGTCRWTGNYIDHADNVAIVDLRPNGSTTSAAPRVVIAGSDAGFILMDLQGHQQAHYPIGHAQSMCIANVIPELEGLEIVVNTFWGAVGITAVLDEAGRLLHDFEPMPYACLLQPVNWVSFAESAQPADLVLLSAHPRQGGLIDGHGRRVVTFPDDGHPVTCSDARDLDGDGIDEVLTWDEEAIWIYKADVPGRTPENYPWRNPWFNDSNYRAQLSLPVV
jgi:hypothetical protein